MIDNLVSDYTTEIEQRLVEELTTKMLRILKNLDQHENNESQ